MTPRVAAVLINFGDPGDTFECVRSLLATGYPELRILVVDNGSGAPVLARLRAELPPGVELLPSDRNLGFSAGNNVAIKVALETGTDYVLVINNDATLKHDALRVMVDAAGAQENLGILAGKILVSNDAGPTDEVWSAGGSWHPLKATGYATGMGERDRGQFDRAGETEFVPGCLWFVPAEVFRRVGLLDEDFFLYVEDADFSFRVRRAGYRLTYEPRAVCYHKVSRSHWKDRKRASPVLNYYNTRNRFLMARKWLSPAQRLVFYAYIFVSRALQALRHRDLSYLRGLWDGVRGKTGPLLAR